MKNVPLPKVLNLTDLDSIVNSDALFARKFDETISKSLIEVLEGRILGGELAAPSPIN